MILCLYCKRVYADISPGEAAQETLYSVRTLTGATPGTLFFCNPLCYLSSRCRQYRHRKYGKLLVRPRWKDFEDWYNNNEVPDETIKSHFNEYRKLMELHPATTREDACNGKLDIFCEVGDEEEVDEELVVENIE